MYKFKENFGRELRILKIFNIKKHKATNFGINFT
jgi:hypothetical protein